MVTLKPNTGLVHRYVYYPATDIKSGAVAGLMQYRQVQQGGSDAPILVNEYQYTSRTALGQTIYLMAKEICCPDANDPLIQLQCKIYNYTWQGNTLQISQKTTTFPIVPTNQNGSGVADSKKESYDAYGNQIWVMDERGYLTNQSFDIATGAIIQRIQDVNTSTVSGAPTGWRTPPGGGLNLVTDYLVDGLGRVTQELGPLHEVDLNGVATVLRRAKWNVYQDAIYQEWKGFGYAVPTSTDYDYTLINPVSLTFNDKSSRPTNIISAVSADTRGALSAKDIFPQSSWVGWIRHTYAGQYNLSRKMVYFQIPTEGYGQRVINYNQSRYFYDSMNRPVREQAPGGTIVRMVYNPMGWAISQWIGTNDSGATDSDPTGGQLGRRMGNNMVQALANEYDNGLAGGDGNLTKQIKFADAEITRTTNYVYDFRNRQIEVNGEIDFCQVSIYDNLDRKTQVDQYDTTTTGTLISRRTSNYDSRGQIYQTIQYGVDPETGNIGPALTDGTWYDPSGNVIQVNKAGSKLLQKTSYDGVNRAIVQYQVCAEGVMEYPYPVNVSQNTVFQQQGTTYDDASNVVQQTIRERFHNATGLGALTTPSGTQPQARVNYVATWADPLGRPHNVANYGTNQGSALIRPSTTPMPSDAILVTTTDYNNAGQAYQLVDPQRIVKRSTFDAAGRLIQSLENYVSGGTESDQNRETNFTYTADSQVATLTAKNNITGDQITQYIYGVTLDNSALASNELLRSVVYPDDSPTNLDRVTMGYNRQNQLTRNQDQMGTVHIIDYDLLGRLANDRIITLGVGVDGAVRRIGRTYEVRGMLKNITSYDSPDDGGNVVNDVLKRYNEFLQLTGQWQSHSGTASPSSPAVQYAYADGADNTVRPIALIYPSGRELNFDYGSVGQANDLLSRIGALVDDDSMQLAAYTYVGLNRIVQVDSPQPSTMLTYIQQGPVNPSMGSGGDQYTGWDQFNRVVDQRWLNTAGADLERCQFGYDQGNNRLWRKNIVAQTGQDEFYAYDGLSQLTDFQRGTLNANNTGFIGIPSWEEDFTFDPTGNWQNYINQVSGQTTLNQNRTHNPVNEILTIGNSNSQISQDATGNITRAPRPENWNSTFTMVYDAWNRLVQVKNGSKLVASYTYDGQKRRITKASGSSTRHYYYTSHWQIIEEQVDAVRTPDRQFVWGLMGVNNLVLRDRVDSNDRLYAFSDSVSITALADTSGTVQERYGYNAYGMPLFLNADFIPIADSQHDWETLYDSYHWDSESGFYQVRHRYLHPGLGRWLTRDPLKYHDGTNLYCYVNNCPVSEIDQSGLSMWGTYCRMACWGALAGAESIIVLGCAGVTVITVFTFTIPCAALVVGTSIACGAIAAFCNDQCPA